MNLSPFQLFNPSTLAALAVAAFAAATAGADTTKTETTTNFWLRISAPEAKGATVPQQEEPAVLSAEIRGHILW